MIVERSISKRPNSYFVKAHYCVFKIFDNELVFCKEAQTIFILLKTHEKTCFIVLYPSFSQVKVNWVFLVHSTQHFSFLPQYFSYYSLENKLKWSFSGDERVRVPLEIVKKWHDLIGHSHHALWWGGRRSPLRGSIYKIEHYYIEASKKDVRIIIKLRLNRNNGPWTIP